MTCKDKFEQQFPGFDYKDYCPDEFHYASRPEWCSEYCGEPECEKCWSREIPEETKKGEPMPEEKPVMMPVYIDGKIVPDLATMTDEICKARRKLIDNGFNKEETFWVIKTLLEGIVK